MIYKNKKKKKKEKKNGLQIKVSKYLIYLPQIAKILKI